MGSNTLRGNQQASRGFTLLELLLAIFIFSIVISTVYASYRTTFHNVQGAQEQADVERRARVILERLSADLEAVYIGNGSFLNGERADGGDVTGARLTFTSTAHLRLHKEATHAGVAVLTYTTLENEETGLLALYRLDEPVMPGMEEGAEGRGTGELLGTGLKEFRLTYVSGEGVEADTWESSEETGEGEEQESELKLPVMVRIEVRFAGLDEDDAGRYFRTAAAVPRRMNTEKQDG